MGNSIIDAILVCRDVKSSNFLLDENGRVKLTDFGLTVARSGDRDFGFTNHNLTDSANKGTPAYMAPECLNNEAFSLKSDIYSFGIVLWELFVLGGYPTTLLSLKCSHVNYGEFTGQRGEFHGKERSRRKFTPKLRRATGSKCLHRPAFPRSIFDW
jgi:serine/threonine protein kinase